MGSKTPEDIINLKSSSKAIMIHAVEREHSLEPKLIMECNNAEYWHKFVVDNVEIYERDFILRTIMDFVYPADIIPLNFVKKKLAFFLARNCLDALLKLTSCKLVIPNPLEPDNPINIMIIANHYPAQQLKFDFEKDVINILRKRYKPDISFLDLKEFHKDEDLKEFFPLSQPKLLLYVLQFAVEFKFHVLDLSCNHIKTLSPIRLLAGTGIHSIDLSYNKIAKMEDLAVLKEFKVLQTLSLSLNPLCRHWDPYSYTKALKELIPTLYTIDGHPAVMKPMAHNIKNERNFLCKVAGGDLVAQFLEHFFMVYDSENRQNIAPLYHENAMFSVTYSIIPNQKKCETIQLNHYRQINRNMKTIQGPRNQFLFRGCKAIMNIFSKFPRSSHDAFTFRCDLIHYTEVGAILVVNGIFREDKQYIGFARNFVLTCENDEYSITNDQLHVYNSLDNQKKSCDCYPMRLNFYNSPLPFYPHQYTELQQAVHQITNLNYDYSQRYLVACHYDLKKTLESFMNMHLKDEVPPEAFIQIGERGLLKKDPLNPNKPIYPQSYIDMTMAKHPMVSPRTVWQTLRDERVAAGYNKCSEDAEEEAEEIKRKVLMVSPSNATEFWKTKQETERNRANQNEAAVFQPNKSFSQIVSESQRQNIQLTKSDPSIGPNGLMDMNIAQKLVYYGLNSTQPNVQQTYAINVQLGTKFGQNQPALKKQVSVPNNPQQLMMQQNGSGPSLQNSITEPTIDLTNSKKAKRRNRKRPSRRLGKADKLRAIIATLRPIS